ncbi:MAG: hypothetical protein BWX92_02879 [Deltaproteobacteria bacterium ADurb.Bin135]|nr:MAG: hypothetical protein BWX92_02879 [Deltaproteobacteria bacterium ADurb.Bin135]
MTNQGQEFRINVNLNELPMKYCDCGYTYFVPRFRIRYLSALQSPNGQAQNLITQEGFVCALCGEEVNLNEQKSEPPSPIQLATS